MSFKPISISLSPNTQKDDVWLAFKLIFQPWKWKKGIAVGQLEDEFKKYFNVKYAISFNSGRSSMLAIMKALNFEPKSEILLQAFTCNAAANPAIWAGYEPKYVDCNEDDFNIDINDLKKKITQKSKAVMVQHTFGMPANMDEVIEFAKQNNLVLIEDCAHSLGAEYEEKKVGTFGRAAFFSFSRDKIISSVYGGIAITNDSLLAEKIRQIQIEFAMPGYFWIFQQLLHPVLLNLLILPIYYFIDLGKIVLIVSQWLHILSKAVHFKEKHGKIPPYFPKRLPNALAILALSQFKKLEDFNEYRQKMADFYYKMLENSGYKCPAKFSNRKSAFLRFTVRHKNAHEIIWQAWKKNNILIGDWYTTPIAPFDTDLEKLKYFAGSCPNAEKLAKTTFNLPTHINISRKDAEKIVKFLLT